MKDENPYNVSMAVFLGILGGLVVWVFIFLLAFEILS